MDVVIEFTCYKVIWISKWQIAKFWRYGTIKDLLNARRRENCPLERSPTHGSPIHSSQYDFVDILKRFKRNLKLLTWSGKMFITFPPLPWALKK